MLSPFFMMPPGLEDVEYWLFLEKSFMTGQKLKAEISLAQGL